MRLNEINKILCQECGFCEQCESVVLADDMITALSETRVRGNYERIYVCSCCADNAKEYMAVF